MKNRIKYSLISAVLSGMAAAALAQSNIYVATNGDDAANSGQSWASPYGTISNGIAKAPTAGDTVWVSNGAYVLSAQLSIANAITVSAWSANAANTIIDGGYPARTGRCVVISAAATLKGFTVSNGVARGNDGGGIYLQNSSCMVTNCIIALNQADSLDASDSGRGGGVFINSSGGRVSDCLFSNNVSSLTQAYWTLNLYGGGGLYCDGYGRVSNCRFITNVVSKIDGGGGGVGISSRSGLDCIVSNCTFDGNLAANGGGLSINGAANSSIRVIDCVFSNNSATNNDEGMGGGVYAYHGVISNCTVAWNQARKNSAGLYLNAATGVNCVIRENQAYGYEAGGISMHYGALLLNSSVINNTNKISGGGSSGGIFMRGTTSRSILRNCLIAGNVVTGNYCIAGIQHHSTDGTNSVVQNCTIVFNRGSTGSGNIGGVSLSTNSFGHYGNIIYYNTGQGYNNWNSTDEKLVVSNSCTTPTNSNVIGTGNITNAPLLIDTNSANYRLAKGSPCINTGLNQDWMIPPGSGGTADLDGRMRRRYGTVDMGAYEAVYNAFVFTAY